MAASTTECSGADPRQSAPDRPAAKWHKSGSWFEPSRAHQLRSNRRRAEELLLLSFKLGVGERPAVAQGGELRQLVRNLGLLPAGVGPTGATPACVTIRVQAGIGLVELRFLVPGIAKHGYDLACED